MEALVGSLERDCRKGFFAEHNWSAEGLRTVQDAMLHVNRALYCPAEMRDPYSNACPRIGNNGFEDVTMSKPIVHAFFMHELWRWLQSNDGNFGTGCWHWIEPLPVGFDIWRGLFAMPAGTGCSDRLLAPVDRLTAGV